MQGSTDPINKVFSSPVPRAVYIVILRVTESTGGGGGGGGGGYKPNGIKFIMFFKNVNVLYIRARHYYCSGAPAQ